MKLILTREVAGLGLAGDIVEVANHDSLRATLIAAALRIGRIAKLSALDPGR